MATRKSKSALADALYNIALDIIESENYDLLADGGLIPNDFANAASNIFKNLLVKGTDDDWAFRSEPVSIYTLGLSWKVQNGLPSFISCSDDSATGVSRSEYFIIDHIGLSGPSPSGVQDLLDMMNEAWYLMKSVKADIL